MKKKYLALFIVGALTLLGSQLKSNTSSYSNGKVIQIILCVDNEGNIVSQGNECVTLPNFTCVSNEPDCGDFKKVTIHIE